MRRIRKDRWQDAFWATLLIEARSPFAWGTADCVLKAARVADSTLVEPVLESLARSSFAWHDEASAVDALIEAGGLLAAVSAVLGPSVPWTRLTQGDLLLCRTGLTEPGRDLCVAVHDGVDPIAFVGDVMRPLPWRLVECGWEV